MATREDRYATNVRPPNPPSPPAPPPPLPKPNGEGDDIRIKPFAVSITDTSPIGLYLTEVMFSGFSPNDVGSSLHRKWDGSFLAQRSDGETFSVDVTFIQTDSPFTTGPMIQQAIEKLMEFRSCGCLPSRKVLCSKHKEEIEEVS